MKVAALVALSVLIALPAKAGAPQNNVSPACDNDGRCTTLNVTAPTSIKQPNLHGQIGTSERKPHRAVDANGNRMLVTVQTAYGFNIAVHPAYASKFLKFFALLKERGHKVHANITRCWAPQGTHVAGSNHYIGAACDIQTGWNRSNRRNRQPTINHEQFATPSSNLTACALPQVLAQVEPEDAFQATGFAYDYLQQADEMRRRLSCRATF